MSRFSRAPVQRFDCTTERGFYDHDKYAVMEESESGEYVRFTDYDALQSEVARLRAEMERYLPVLERAEQESDMWAWITRGTGIATANGYREALAREGQ